MFKKIIEFVMLKKLYDAYKAHQAAKANPPK